MVFALEGRGGNYGEIISLVKLSSVNENVTKLKEQIVTVKYLADISLEKPLILEKKLPEYQLQNLQSLIYM